MKKMLAAVSLLLASTLSVASLADGIAPANDFCPVDGGKSTLQGSPGSAYPMGSMLDLQPCQGYRSPHGPIPTCSSSQLPMYRTFSEEEIERLREFAKTSEFAKASTTGNQIVSTMRFLHEDPDRIAFELLSKSWYREQDYPEYAKAALEAYIGILQNPPHDKQLWKSQQFVAGELERRLARFDDARRRFLALRGSSEFADAESADRIALELRLIDDEDTHTSSTNQDCRSEHHAHLILPLPACKNPAPLGNDARFADFCSCRPQYPKVSVHAEETGEVAVTFTIDPNNKLIDERLVQSSGFKNLDFATKNELAQCRFKAATRDGKPVEGSFTAKFKWSIDYARQTADIQPDVEME